jgi:hypothetical protein
MRLPPWQQSCDKSRRRAILHFKMQRNGTARVYATTSACNDHINRACTACSSNGAYPSGKSGDELRIVLPRVLHSRTDRPGNDRLVWIGASMLHAQHWASRPAQPRFVILFRQDSRHALLPVVDARRFPKKCPPQFSMIS